MALPTPTASQAFCHVSALEGGIIQAYDDLFITDAVPGKRQTLPSLCFLIQHSQKQEKFLFDLGLKTDFSSYTPAVQAIMNAPVFDYSVPQDCLQSLAKGGTTPDDIDFVCISHLHFDHTGDTSAFTKSTFIVSDECRPLLAKTFPEDPASHYRANLLPPGRTRYLPVVEWKPIGPFPRAFDFYGDGSLYIVDSPGHLPGHVNILARTSPDGAWIYLAGDSAHHWGLITGEGRIKVGQAWDQNFCMHVDKAKAEEHISKIQALRKLHKVRVVLAHDVP